MKITVQVKLKSKKEGVEKVRETLYIVRCHEPPIDGKANKKIHSLLCHYFKKSKSQVRLLHGHKSKIKVFEIDEEKK